MTLKTPSIERNWTPGQAFLPDIKPAEDSINQGATDEAIIAIVIELVKSQEANDGKYFIRTLENGRLEITGPGAYMTLSQAMYDSIIKIMKGE